MKVRVSSQVGPFRGAMTVGALQAALYALPSDAVVRVEKYDNQMDGSGWSVSGEWMEER